MTWTSLDIVIHISIVSNFYRLLQNVRTQDQVNLATRTFQGLVVQFASENKTTAGAQNDGSSSGFSIHLLNGCNTGCRNAK